MIVFLVENIISACDHRRNEVFYFFDGGLRTKKIIEFYYYADYNKNIFHIAILEVTMNINTIQNSNFYSIWQPNTNKEIANKEITNKAINVETKDANSVKKEASSDFIKEQGGELTKAEEMLITELKQIEQAVRKHEMAHVAAGGRYILSGANYSYKTGPDGKQYIVGGEVKIDTSPVPGDPQATINKMRQVRSAALAPADPSPQDRKVAATAMTISTKAMSELMISRTKEKIDSNEEKAFGNIKHTAGDTYIQIQKMPGNQQEPSFSISA